MMNRLLVPCSLSTTQMATDLLPHLSGERYYDPQKWSPRHKLCVALHMGGDRNTEVAQKLNCSTAWVSKTLGDIRATYEIEQLATTLADRTADTALRIKLYANEALDEIMDELRESRSEGIRQKAAFGILDRAGYTPSHVESDAAPPLLPESVVDRMEAAAADLKEHEIVYAEVVPEELAEEEKDG